jgi:hypothetical protein
MGVIEADDLAAFARRALGFHSASSMDSGTRALVDECVDRAVQAFFLPAVLPGENVSHIWSFLHGEHVFYTIAPYSTGTIAISASSTTVAGTGTTFTAAMAAGQLIVNDQMFEIASHGGTDALTLNAAPVTAVAAGTSYQIAFIHYAQPTNFAGNIGPVTFAPGQGSGPLKVISAEALDNIRQTSGVNSGRPEFIAFGGADDQGTAVIKVWPTPDAEYQLRFRYMKSHLAMSSITDIPRYHADTLFAAMSMVIAEAFGVGDPNGSKQYFLQRLSHSVSMDRSLRAAETGDVLGYNADRSDGRFGRNRPNLYTSDVTVTQYSDPLGLGRLL